MASDIFAKIGDIKGESLDSKHKDEIDILSFSWGVTQTGGMATGGAGAGKAQFQDFHFTSNTSKASPVLLKACATGEHIKEATITVRKAGERQLEFLIIKMNDILISSYQSGGSAPNDSVPTDQVGMAFAKVDYSYYPQKPDGSLDAPVTVRFDIKGNKEG